MTATWFTADTHFFHKRIIEFCPWRIKFSNSESAEPAYETMVAGLVTEWNSIVGTDDLVYHLGDVAFCGVQKAVATLQSLNGRKILILGNHDQRLAKSEQFLSCFEKVYWLKKIKLFDGTRAVLCHFPLLEWEDMQHGNLMLHGHTHGNRDSLHEFKILDVGMDATQKLLISEKEIVELLLNKKIRSHHG